MVIVSISTKKEVKDVLVDQVDHNILGITSVFTCDGAFNQALTNMGFTTNLGDIFAGEERRICNRYGSCVNSFLKCLFSIIGFRLPFNELKVNILNHLLITPSQLYLVSYTFIKLFHYWFDYIGSRPTMTLFFHLFKIQNIPITQMALVYFHCDNLSSIQILILKA